MKLNCQNHEVLQACRRKKFQDKITKQLEHHDLEMYRSLLEDLFTADQDQEDIAAAMLMLLQGKQKLILPPDPPMDKRRRDRNDRGDRRENPRSAERRGERKGYGTPQPMDLYRIEVGRADGVEVRHIVGAIAMKVILTAVILAISNFMMSTLPLNYRKVCQKNCSNNSVKRAF